MICKLCLPLICINSTWLVFIVFLWFISPLWEMSQEGIDIKTIQWSQHWSPRCAHSTQTPHLYLAQQCCVEGGLIVLFYILTATGSCHATVNLLLLVGLLRISWNICWIHIFLGQSGLSVLGFLIFISLYLWKVFNGGFIHILPINQNNVIQQ